MDYAKHELKNAKSPEVIEMNNSLFEQAQKLFEIDLQKVTLAFFYPLIDLINFQVLKLLDKFPRQKETHLRNIQNFFTVYKIYHEQMAAALKVK